MTFLLHLRLLSMQREDQIELTAPSSPKKIHDEAKDMFKTFITCESWCCCCCCCSSWWWWCYWAMCFCMWMSERKNNTNEQNDERKRQSAYWCYYALQWFHLSLVRSFVCSFVCWWPHWLFCAVYRMDSHIYVKNTHLILLLTVLPHPYLGFFLFSCSRHIDVLHLSTI